MAAKLRRVEAHAQERADAQYAEDMLGGGVGVNDPVVGVGNQHAVPGRKRAVCFRVQGAAGVLQDHARRFHQALAAPVLKLARGDFEADDGDGVVAVVDAVGVHFQRVGVDEVPAKPHSRLPVGQRLGDQRLRFRGYERTDGGQPQGLHHGMGAGLCQHKQTAAVAGRSVETRLGLREVRDEGQALADVFQKFRLPPRNVRMGAAKRAYVVHVFAPFFDMFFIT